MPSRPVTARASPTWYDHTGPVGASIGAMSDCPTGHTLHGPFTDQTSMLYQASPAGTGSWPSPTPAGHGPPNLRWAGVSTTASPCTAIGSRKTKRTSCSPGPGRRGEGAPSGHRGGPAGRAAAGHVSHKKPARADLLGRPGGAAAGRRYRGPGECDQTQKTALLARAAGCCSRSSGQSRSDW
jgi:hypothetical protein